MATTHDFNLEPSGRPGVWRILDADRGIGSLARVVGAAQLTYRGTFQIGSDAAAQATIAAFWKWLVANPQTLRD